MTEERKEVKLKEIEQGRPACPRCNAYLTKTLHLDSYTYQCYGCGARYKEASND